METTDNEEVTFESINDHFYKFDAPELLEPNPETESFDSGPSLASAFTLARPILLAMIATPLIPERWQEAIDTLASALDDAVADAKESASGWEGDLPVCGGVRNGAAGTHGAVAPEPAKAGSDALAIPSSL